MSRSLSKQRNDFEADFFSILLPRICHLNQEKHRPSLCFPLLHVIRSEIMLPDAVQTVNVQDVWIASLQEGHLLQMCTMIEIVH